MLCEKHYIETGIGFIRNTLLKKKKTITEISESLSTCKSVISAWLRRHQIPARDISSCQQPNKQLHLLQSRDWLIDRYITQGKSTTEIAAELNCANSTVGTWLRKHHIKTRGIKESRMSDNENFALINNSEYLKGLYIEHGLICQEIAKMLSCGTQTIYRKLKEAGVEIVTFEDRMLEKNPRLKKLRSKNWLYQRYITENTLTPQIAEELGTSASMVAYWLKKHGIPTKDWHDTHGVQKYTDEQMEEMLRAVGKRIGRIPSARDLDRFCKEGLCPSSMTYGLRGGIPFWQKKVFDKSLEKWRAWEYECISLFNKILGFPNFKREKRFNWLRSPITNYHLRIDVFYPEYKLCVEFDGEAHFRPVRFLPDQDPEKEFEKVRLHDSIKNELIPKHGLKLLRFRFDEPLTIEHVRERLSQFVNLV